MTSRSIAAGAFVLAAAGTTLVGASSADAGGGRISFDMQRSPGIVAAGCLPDAKAEVTVRHDGPVERMRVDVSGLPADTEFDTFVIQVPNAPFGVAWYQGDIETNSHGRGHQEYVGRFSQETFAVALNTAPAPSVHSSPIADATTNPPFAPIHTFHVGIGSTRRPTRPRPAAPVRPRRSTATTPPGSRSSTRRPSRSPPVRWAP